MDLRFALLPSPFQQGVSAGPGGSRTIRRFPTSLNVKLFMGSILKGGMDIRKQNNTLSKFILSPCNSMRILPTNLFQGVDCDDISRLMYKNFSMRDSGFSATFPKNLSCPVPLTFLEQTIHSMQEIAVLEAPGARRLQAHLKVHGLQTNRLTLLIF